MKFAKPFMVILILVMFTTRFCNAPIQELKYIEVETETNEVINTEQETEIKTEEKVMQEIKNENPTEDTRKRYERIENTSRSRSERIDDTEIPVDFITPCTGRKSQGYHSGHRAVDICNSYGTEIYASADGVCVKKVHSNAGYGNYIVLEHENGYKTLYAHLSKIVIDIDQEIKSGELIGYMGSTGRSTGNHLHFEIHKNGVQQNPLKYITLNTN